MKSASDDDRYSEEETARRADEVIRRMMKTPPQPRRSPMTPKPKERSVPKRRVRKRKAKS
jgi:hypothetical protein